MREIPPPPPEVPVCADVLIPPPPQARACLYCPLASAGFSAALRLTKRMRREPSSPQACLFLRALNTTPPRGRCRLLLCCSTLRT